MSYIKTNWEDNITPVSATNLNNMEQGIEDAHVGIVDLKTVELPKKIDKPMSATNGNIAMFDTNKNIIDSLKSLSELVQTISGSYTGDGTTDRFINLGFTPKLVFVAADTFYGTGSMPGAGLGILGTNIGFGRSSSTNDETIELKSGNYQKPIVVTNGFTVSETTSNGTMNRSGEGYHYIAIG